MVNPLVERATSDLLLGPDWAKNSEICDILIHDPGQVKDVVKGVRRKIGSRNPKVQILALTLLETLMNNCGDFVHMHVAERGVLRKMMKISKKKRNYHVREKILMLIENWSEAFGEAGSRHPQYYAAFHNLLRAGVVFPRRSDKRAPIFTPQNQSYPPTQQQETATEESDFPTLSLSEIQNARSIVDVLAEMLNGLDPGNEESIKQDAIVDLVKQCRTYKQRVVHLINSTSDESLLSQGLALNDDLQRLLTKHEAIASGNSGELVKQPPLQALIDIDDDPVITTDDHISTVNQLSIDLLLPVPTSSDGTGMDLLSGGDMSSSPTAENSLALVPAGDSQENSHVPDLSDMLSQNNLADPQSIHSAMYGNDSNIGSAQHQNETLANGTQGDSSLPPPPWEMQTTDNQQPHYPQEMQITHVESLHSQQMHNNMHLHPINSNQMTHMYAQQPQTNSEYEAIHNQHMQNYQLAYHQAYYQSVQSNQHFQPQYIDQRMYGLTIGDQDPTSYAQVSTPSSYMQPSLRQKPEDKLFGDLVSMAKSKPKNSSSSSSIDTPNNPV